MEERDRSRSTDTQSRLDLEQRETFPQTNGLRISTEGKPGSCRQSRPPLALTIAGSDSSGGAGIQGDLKTFQELNVYGMSVVTAVTAQNSHGVMRGEAMSTELVAVQMESVLGDMGTNAAKTGMMPTERIVATAAAAFRQYKVRNLVVDPVHTAKNGYALAGGDAFDALKRLLLPLAEIVTPNLPEACLLLGVPESEVRTLDERIGAAWALLGLGSHWVLLKGGHAEGAACTDILVGHGREKPLLLESPRCHTIHTHGTGCTLSAAIAAYLARGFSVENACREAKVFLTQAIEQSIPLGTGRGSLWHAAWRNQAVLY